MTLKKLRSVCDVCAVFAVSNRRWTKENATKHTEEKRDHIEQTQQKEKRAKHTKRGNNEGANENSREIIIKHWQTE